MIDAKNNIAITKTTHSRVEAAFKSDLQFGRLFSDHMFVADYQNGKWENISIIPYQKISFEPSCLVFHYGQAIFEGMKAYKTSDGEVLLFRPQANIKRFNKSAERMCMPTIPDELFLEGLKQLMEIDSAWVPQGEGTSLYIRPFMIATDEYLGVKPSEKYRFIIITSPVGAYYKEPVKVKVETHYTRAVEGGTGFAKSSGNYAQSLYPAKKASEKGYHQLLWTDAIEHKYIEESGTMNVMFVLENKKIITPALSNTILNGVTRDSVLKLAHDMGYIVEERKVSVEEVIKAIKNKTLSEAFGTGTAATIAHISQIGFEDNDYFLPTPTESSFSKKVLKKLDQIRRGEITDPFNWVTRLK